MKKEKNDMEGKTVIFVESENDAENADGVRGHLEWFFYHRFFWGFPLLFG